MKGNIKNVNIFLLFDFLIFILFILGIYNFSVKADLPFSITSLDDKLIITRSSSINYDSFVGGIIKSIDGFGFENREEIEIYLDSKSLDELVIVQLQKDHSNQNLTIPLKPFYSMLYDIIAVIIGLTFFITGFIVLIKSKSNEVGIIFHWCMVTTASIIFMTWGNFTDLGSTIGIITRSGFHLGYALVPTFFLHFAFIFPTDIKINFRKYLSFLYLTSVLFAVSLSYVFIKYTYSVTLENINLYINAFNICSIYVIVLVLTSIFVQFRIYFSTNNIETRKKLRWILLGYILGPMSYLFLWVIPQRLTTNGLIPEEIVLLLVAAVPITFGIAIIKHQLMDVEIIIRRTIVYPIALSILLIIYFGFFTILVNSIHIPNPEVSSIIAAIFIALVFHPIKEFVKRFVNKKIFKVEYDYRETVRSFLEEIKELTVEQILLEKVISFIEKVIPVNNLGYFNSDQNKNLKLIANKNLREFENKIIEFNLDEIKNNDFNPYFSKNSVANELRKNSKSFTEFSQLKFEIIYPIKSSMNNFYGLLVLGGKKSSAKFSVEDIDLLNTIATELGNGIERIKLHEQLFFEKVEKQKLAELNEQKSFFVSSVSHDLKTPLTSIKMFAELIKNKENISDQKINQYLEIIEGESNRLTRLIDNVLNFSKIERGVKDYSFENINLNSIMKDVILTTEYLFKIQKFDSAINLGIEELIIYADKDAVTEAVINIISNGIKFSKDNRFIKISTYKEDKFAVAEIEDQGIGIDEYEIENLFTPYFQSKQLSNEHLTGAGLGLAIVKHIIDAHNGKIIVKSKIGNGAKFKLYFPLMGVTNETNIDN
ncbi:MAG: hypothetical protein HYS24_04035 [Ignavibacteriales bacterium]|nr:hypothetical protein [Ignavibacteriales bacterium]